VLIDVYEPPRLKLFPMEEYHVEPELYVDPARFSTRGVRTGERIVWGLVKRDE